MIQYRIQGQRGRNNWQWEYYYKTEKEAREKFEAIKHEWDYLTLTKEQFKRPGGFIKYTSLIRKVA